MRGLIAALAAVLFLVSLPRARADPVEEAPNWKEQALRHLAGVSGRGAARPATVDQRYLAAVEAEDQRRRRISHERGPSAGRDAPPWAPGASFTCVRKNNYWCLKNASRWPGVIGEDRLGHAVFASADLAAQAKISIMRRYYLECGFRTLTRIMCVYTPECAGDSRDTQDCAPQRDCVRYARYLADRMRTTPDADIALFDAEGRPTGNLRRVMRFSSTYETGHFVAKDSLIEAGIQLEAAQWRRLLESQRQHLPGLCGRR